MAQAPLSRFEPRAVLVPLDDFRTIPERLQTVIMEQDLIAMLVPVKGLREGRC